MINPCVCFLCFLSECKLCFCQHFCLLSAPQDLLSPELSGVTPLGHVKEHFPIPCGPLQKPVFEAPAGYPVF